MEIQNQDDGDSQVRWSWYPQVMSWILTDEFQGLDYAPEIEPATVGGFSCDLCS